MAGTDYSFDGLDAWEQRLSQAVENEYPEEFKQMVIDVALQLEGLVKERTPVDTGHLRRSWHVGPVRKEGNEYVVEVYNNIDYAEAVEYGHRQQPGRYVPALGKRLKADYVEGTHMMELSLMDVSAALPGYLQEWLADFISTHDL